MAGYAQIAEQHGVSVETVRDIVKHLKPVTESSYVGCSYRYDRLYKGVHIIECEWNKHLVINAVLERMCEIDAEAS